MGARDQSRAPEEQIEEPSARSGSKAKDCSSQGDEEALVSRHLQRVSKEHIHQLSLAVKRYKLLEKHLQGSTHG